MQSMITRLVGWAIIVLGLSAVAQAQLVTNFTALPLSGTVPLTVQFTDTTTGCSPPATITLWDWNFGDGTAHGTVQNPSHQYTAAGTYTVSLTATCSDGETKAGYINITVPAPAPVLSGTPMTITLPKVTLSWGAVLNADSCTGTGAWSGAKGVGGGSEIVYPTVSPSTLYTLSCTGPGGTGSSTQAVAVSLQP